MGEMENSERESNEFVEGFYEIRVGGKGHPQPQGLGWIGLTALFFFSGDVTDTAGCLANNHSPVFLGLEP